ncbi:M23 family metallopeptidase [Pseudonocardia asaccharolytica]|uniref:M23ase beta-sheet core domain-containing protein n=1 Tax=Pseudonocardia asaccharolytica DSM 44247 = NBRC 16224 TaxID=1123024 RepID=A0A511D790_9PSEU|nr:M23 family metallopeptidase [Pseudonocardia asaccharolytica]GEL20669.1 hypothetical protein PA7_45060 [Pseudonocardia asaccharolytica DSM 44247 = NBRC 16224]
MSRHRSPKGRRAHHGPPLLAAWSVAGAGGTHRALSPTRPTPPRWAATAAAVIAGGTLAGAGYAAQTGDLPVVTDAAHMLRLGAEQPTGSGAPAPAEGPVIGADLAALAAPQAAAPAPGTTASLVAAVDPRQEAATAAAKATDAAAAVQAVQVAKAQEAQRAKTAQAARPPAQVQVALAAQVKSAVGGVQVVAGRVSSGFGMRGGAMHSGLDIAAPIGTPIHTPLAGTVISSGPASGFGLWVRVQHGDGTITVYGHINRSLVQVGQKVSAGQQIAEVGNRGQSTGPHLHIEVISPGGQKINPRPWLDSHGFRYR